MTVLIIYPGIPRSLDLRFFLFKADFSLKWAVTNQLPVRFSVGTEQVHVWKVWRLQRGWTIRHTHYVVGTNFIYLSLFTNSYFPRKRGPGGPTRITIGYIVIKKILKIALMQETACLKVNCKSHLNPICLQQCSRIYIDDRLIFSSFPEVHSCRSIHFM